MPSKDRLLFASHNEWRRHRLADISPLFNRQLFRDFRNDAGKTRDKLIWGTTYKPYTSNLDLFWASLKKQLEYEKLQTRIRIIKQVAELIALHEENSQHSPCKRPTPTVI